MKEWVYNGMATGITDSREMARIMYEDIHYNPEVSDVFNDWFTDFGEIYTDTRLLDMIIERADGVSKVSDLLDDLVDMFLDWFSENECQMEYCGAVFEDFDAKREDWEADNRD